MMSTSAIPKTQFLPPMPGTPMRVKLVTASPLQPVPGTLASAKEIALAAGIAALADRYANVDRDRCTRMEWKTWEQVARDLQALLQGNPPQ
jgi:hypothetical protein